MPPPPFTPSLASHARVGGITSGVNPNRSGITDVYLSGCATPIAPSMGMAEMSDMGRYQRAVSTPTNGATYSPVRGMYSGTEQTAAVNPLKVETQVEKATVQSRKVEHEPSGQPRRQKIEAEKPVRAVKVGKASTTGPQRSSQGRRPSESRRAPVKTPTMDKVAKASQPLRQATSKRSPPLIELSPPKKQPGMKMSVLDGQTGVEAARKEAGRMSTDDAQMDEWRVMSKSVQLHEVSVGKAVRHFTEQCRGGDMIGSTENAAEFTLLTFTTAYRSLIESCGMSPDEDSDEQIARLFGVLDCDKDGRVDLMELVCGVCLICSGTEKEKLHSVFEVFDTNGDGRMSLDEITAFLRNVYRIVLTPSVVKRMKQVGITLSTAEDLAAVTAKECFASADPTGSGAISFEEFYAWFCTPHKQALSVAGSMNGLFN
ncbi:conserved hypothetical protein [Perkinsus marinus ATCC 50983]|uniref:EF-hand domain-containing protein n=2 Tax=Perkinsus marinus (strain ATCC 50983 / TXsc) TaxID=423536 RepID=C5LJK5_PERM5|nr:conserved hypothetical protein [Perkinsus marinus ATCC 50983]EER03134.1 conserved hypothetical protein [Perkinsus marinus ATCC 50983]|eukprot:XP_002771318.1 conserved hypothetical protein [Perkinsus marinus ATCC 50983]